jgi:metallophosphoesterase superfamily enzyme
MSETATAIPRRVEQMATILQRFSREELAQLVVLVPDLKDVEPASIPQGETAVAYFRRLATEMHGGIAPSPHDQFLERLTYEQYLALSEEVEEALWDRLFAEGEMDIKDFEEHEVKPAAYVPARQERNP